MSDGYGPASVSTPVVIEVVEAAGELGNTTEPLAKTGLLAPPPHPLLLGGRAHSEGIPGAPAPPAIDLRRARSEPPVPDDPTRGPRFTDKMLMLLTRETASTTPAKQPVEPIAFGKDPPARPSAAKVPGTCNICCDEKDDTVQLCWNSDCKGRFCEECVRRFAEGAVENAMYAVPWFHCPGGCNSRIPTSSWSALAPEAYGKYVSHAEALLTYRCTQCHEPGNLLTEASKNACIPSSLDEVALTDAWQDFVYAATRPDTIANLVPDESDLKKLLSCVGDMERRVCLHLAWLRENPFIMLECCDDSPFCFKCKIGSHHEGETCEQRQMEELDIYCQFCPECEVPTIRTEGCDHIVCVCGADWTWQEQVELGWVLGPLANLREVLRSGLLDPLWINTSDEDESQDNLLIATAGAGATYLEHTRLLLEAGSDVNYRNSEDYSPLLCAFGAKTGTYTPEVVDLLMEHNAELSRSDPYTWMGSQGSAVSSSVNAFAQVLRMSGVSIKESRSNEGFLQIALRRGRKDLALHLISEGVHVDSKAPFWFVRGPLRDESAFDQVFVASGMSIDDVEASLRPQTLLQVLAGASGFYVQSNTADLVKLLISKYGAKASFADLVKNPGEFWAEAHCILPLDIFRALLAQGADIWAPDHANPSNRGWFLSRVVKAQVWLKGKPSYRQRELGRQIDALQDLILQNWSDTASSFARTDGGALLLTLAIHLQRWPVAERLINSSAGMETATLECSCPNDTPLLAATRHCNSAMVELLINSKADVLAANDSGVVERARKASWSEGVTILERAVQAAAEEQANKMASSGDGSLEMVGIKLDGTVACSECRQQFPSDRALRVHWCFIHDPNRHQED
jgi:ankyrin repeat protein